MAAKHLSQFGENIYVHLKDLIEFFEKNLKDLIEFFEKNGNPHILRVDILLKIAQNPIVHSVF